MIAFNMLDAIAVAKFLEELIKEFDKVSFAYLFESHNQFANALTTLLSMIQVINGLDIEPLKIKILRKLTHYMVVTGNSYGKPWHYDIIT